MVLRLLLEAWLVRPSGLNLEGLWWVITNGKADTLQKRRKSGLQAFLLLGVRGGGCKSLRRQVGMEEGQGPSLIPVVP